MSIFDEIEGLEPVEPEKLKDFLGAMENEVIPAIIEAQKEREKAYFKLIWNI